MNIGQAITDMMQTWDTLTPDQQRIQYEHVLRVAMTDDQTNARRIAELQRRVAELEEK